MAQLWQHGTDAGRVVVTCARTEKVSRNATKLPVHALRISSEASHRLWMKQDVHGW